MEDKITAFMVEKEEIRLLINKGYELIRNRLEADDEISFNSQVTASRIKP